MNHETEYCAKLTTTTGCCCAGIQPDSVEYYVTTRYSKKATHDKDAQWKTRGENANKRRPLPLPLLHQMAILSSFALRVL